MVIDQFSPSWPIAHGSTRTGRQLQNAIGSDTSTRREQQQKTMPYGEVLAAATKWNMKPVNDCQNAREDCCSGHRILWPICAIWPFRQLTSHGRVVRFAAFAMLGFVFVALIARTQF